MVPSQAMGTGMMYESADHEFLRFVSADLHPIPGTVGGLVRGRQRDVECRPPHAAQNQQDARNGWQLIPSDSFQRQQVVSVALQFCERKYGMT